MNSKLIILVAFMLLTLTSCDHRTDEQKAQDEVKEEVKIVTINGHRYIRYDITAAACGYQHEASCYEHDLDSIHNKQKK